MTMHGHMKHYTMYMFVLSTTNETLTSKFLENDTLKTNSRDGNQQRQIEIA